MAAEEAMERRGRSIIGSVLNVLVERFDRESDSWVGRSHREAPEVDGEIIFTADHHVHVGDFVPVRITENEGADLNGKLER